MVNTGLPHPRIRHVHPNTGPQIASYIDQAYARLKTIMDGEEISVYEATAQAIESIIVRNFPVASEAAKKDFRIVAKDSLFARHFEENKGVVIETTAELDTLMDNTDVDDLPCRYLRPPFPLVYFNFTQPLFLDGHDLGIYGVYVQVSRLPVHPSYIETRARDREIIDPDDIINYFDITWSIGERDWQSQQACLYAGCDFTDKSEIGVVETLKNMSDRDLENSTTLPSELRLLSKHATSRIFKTIAYMSTKDYRIVPLNEYSALKSKIDLLGTKKQAKAINKLGVKYDRLIVGPERQPDAVRLNYDASGKVVATHWRRGHFRNQNYGPGRLESHLIWIQPTIVNAVDAAPTPKTYKIKV